GRYIPTIAVDATGRPMLVLEDYAVPPHLVVLEVGGPRTVLTSETAGSAAATARTGTVETLAWTGAEGWSIEGLLAIPAGEGPHPLVVNVHGGPISAWRNNWCGRDAHTNALVAAGYSVLKPNPRGSFGRGAKFAEAVLGDMGGLDAHDILSGVETLRARPDVDVSRTGVTGNSYGGYMATWLPTLSDVIRASVARSPVTDWLTQHLTSNITAFDERFLDGSPFDDESQFRTRSPLHRVEAITIPVMLTAGALDLATPASQAQILHAALREAGVPSSLVVYPEEGHGVRRQEALVDQCTRMVGWFDRHLTRPDGG
ncbi:MAG TPA: prolyl oligopeptidase family serine peptidase, partial [Mycobacterium sp.]